VLVTFDTSVIGVVRALHEHEVRFVLVPLDTGDDRYTIVYENAKSNIQALTRAMHEIGAVVSDPNLSVSVAAPMIQNSPRIIVTALGRGWSLAKAINGAEYESLITTSDSVVLAPPFRTPVATF
jgi:hypothetical protein